MHLTGIDKYIVAIDKALKVLTFRIDTQQTEPKNATSISLMRVNYSGEIAAQGLYLGAGLIETDPKLQAFYRHAMVEEFMHLEMCGNRVYQMGGEVSVFNPIWFAGAFALGLGSRLLGKSYALGFVVETEHQVLSHLDKHLSLLPENDTRSRQVLEQMIQDEEAHGNEARDLGAATLPAVACKMMSHLGRVLTTMSSWG